MRSLWGQESLDGLRTGARPTGRQPGCLLEPLHENPAPKDWRVQPRVGTASRGFGERDPDQGRDLGPRPHRNDLIQSPIVVAPSP